MGVVHSGRATIRGFHLSYHWMKITDNTLHHRLVHVGTYTRVASVGRPGCRRLMSQLGASGGRRAVSGRLLAVAVLQFQLRQQSGILRSSTNRGLLYGARPPADQQQSTARATPARASRRYEEVIIRKTLYQPIGEELVSCPLLQRANCPSASGAAARTNRCSSNQDAFRQASGKGAYSRRATLRFHIGLLQVDICSCMNRGQTPRAASPGARPASKTKQQEADARGRATAPAAEPAAEAASGCTLRDLCPDDKAKVAKLIKQVVDLEGENKRLKDAGRPRDQGDACEGEGEGEGAPDAAADRGEERLRQLQETNRQVIGHNIA
jgi:hypothetical protein